MDHKVAALVTLAKVLMDYKVAVLVTLGWASLNLLEKDRAQ